MAKFDPLKNYLQDIPNEQDECTLSFKQFEEIIQSNLPPSAFKHRAWWSNEEHGVHVSARAWMGAGWKVDAVNQREQWVRFIRKAPVLQTKPKIQFSNPEDRKDTSIGVKRMMFSANRPVRTVVMHKPECRVIPWEELDPCGCGDRGGLGNQRWFCEDDITRQAVDEFMNGKFWAILMCDICF